MFSKQVKRKMCNENFVFLNIYKKVSVNFNDKGNI